MTDIDPEAFAADLTPVTEGAPVPTDWTEPGVAGELDPDQSADFAVIDPDTGEDTEAEDDATSDAPFPTPEKDA